MWLEASARIKDKNTMVLSCLIICCFTSFFLKKQLPGYQESFREKICFSTVAEKRQPGGFKGNLDGPKVLPWIGKFDSLGMLGAQKPSSIALIGGTSPLIVRGFVKMGPFFGMSDNLNFNPNVTHQTLDFSVFHLSPPTNQL